MELTFPVHFRHEGLGLQLKGILQYESWLGLREVF